MSVRYLVESWAVSLSNACLINKSSLSSQGAPLLVLRSTPYKINVKDQDLVLFNINNNHYQLKIVGD